MSICDSRSKSGRLSRCLIHDDSVNIFKKYSRLVFYHLMMSIFYIGRFGVDVVDVVVCFVQKVFFLLVGYGYYSYSVAVKLPCLSE